MTLSGNLGFVPLDEVLRLLTRSGNSGVVEITNGAIRGRIFVAGEGIGIATTFDDAELGRHLLSSGYVESGAGDGQVRFNDDLLALVREMTVEGIYRMDGENADFQVVRDTSSPYSAPQPFDLEKILTDSRKRADQWAEVSEKIPDLAAELKVNRALRRDSIQLDRESWRVLSEVGAGASVQELASSLGTTEYAVASVAAAMVEDELLIMEGAEVGHLSEPSIPSPQETFDPGDETAAEVADPTPATEIDPDRSWWDEPETPGAEVDDEPADEATDETAAEAETDGVEDDTDAFLEKVFSEVSNESEEDGHGLMRRRRMGSILRELGED